MRAKIEELETNSKIQNIRNLYRGSSDFKKGYQPRCNIVKDEKGDLVADSHGIVATWRNYLSHQFNVRGLKDVGQAEIHTAEPLVPEPSASEIELAIDNLLYRSHIIDVCCVLLFFFCIYLYCCTYATCCTFQLLFMIKLRISCSVNDLTTVNQTVPCQSALNDWALR